jgi:hypothetical protein
MLRKYEKYFAGISSQQNKMRDYELITPEIKHTAARQTSAAMQ